TYPGYGGQVIECGSHTRSSSVILSKGERTVGKTHRVYRAAKCHIGANWVQEGLPNSARKRKARPSPGEAPKSARAQRDRLISTKIITKLARGIRRQADDAAGLGAGYYRERGDRHCTWRRFCPARAR